MSPISSPEKTDEKWLAEKWQKLQDQHQHLQRRQDKIDVLALDTLLKMEVLLARLKTLQAYDVRNEGGQDQELRNDSNQRQVPFDENCMECIRSAAGAAEDNAGSMT